MTEQVTFITTLLSVYAIAVTAILIFRNGLVKNQAGVMGLFIISLISYLLMDQKFHPYLFEVLVSGAFLLPFSFWKLSKMIFSDEEQPLTRLGIEAIIVLIFYHGLIQLGWNQIILPYAIVTMKITSISFLALSIVESQRGKKDDLVKSRLKLRKTFVYFIAITGLITILTETSLATTEMVTLKMVQRIAILLFSSYFLIVNSAWKEGFLGKKVKAAKVLHQDLINAIQELMLDQKFYKQEGLTIGQLAEKLNEQEYKLRSVINQEMGYRNFPAFVNSFRIEEAKELLLINGKEKLTIQEIAFETGFNSIGPFNRAFKAETNMTPKAFRDQSSLQS
ncbi:MAG: AraC family transcriptional regulator [Roseivirga sp.]|nr:AraC family transcriptional regulator [Roseivirga sp.]